MNKPVYNQETKEHEINGISFDGHFVEWRLEYQPKTYLKESELSGNQYRKGGYVRIYRNEDCVLEEFCREPEHALMLLGKGLYELKCWFETVYFKVDDDWKEELIGRKVRHGCIPSTVERYCGNGEIILKRDDGKRFGPDLYPSLEDGEFGQDEWKDRDRVHITDKRVNWSIK